VGLFLAINDRLLRDAGRERRDISGNLPSPQPVFNIIAKRLSRQKSLDLRIASVCYLVSRHPSLGAIKQACIDNVLMAYLKNTQQRLAVAETTP